MVIKLLGWAATIAGSILYLFGYLSEPGQTLIDWVAFTPSWIASFIPNRVAEYGLVISLFGNALLYVPPSN
ncbi:MAG: hypothetical protein U1E46_05880 [Hyphomicrobiales bacterium]